MSKKDKLIIVMVIFAVLLADQITKSWVAGLDDLVDFGFVRFFPTYNKAAFWGIFANLPQNLKQVGLATFGGVFIIFFGLIQLVIAERLIWLRIGFSILLGGMLGNVIDRLLMGHVLDFIIFGSKEVIFCVVNLADLFQITGWLLIVYNVVAHYDIVWPKNNKRKQKWINPGFQRRFILYNFTILGSISLVLLVFTFSFLKVTLNEYLGFDNEISEHIYLLFLRLYLIINCVLFMCYFVIALIASHRIAGPVYAFKKYTNDLLNHTHLQDFDRPLVLRKNDEFEELVELSQAIKKKMYAVPNPPSDRETK